MRISNVTKDVMLKALQEVNKRFKNNIKFKYLDSVNQKGTSFSFTLGIHDSKAPGHRLGYRRRIEHRTGITIKQSRLAHACWHVHGYLFEEVFKLCPNAKVRSRGVIITKDVGNWEDYNIGSMREPMYFSEACACE